MLMLLSWVRASEAPAFKSAENQGGSRPAIAAVFGVFPHPPNGVIKVCQDSRQECIMDGFEMNPEIAYVTPTVIKWARERVGLNRDELAAKMAGGVTGDHIKAWETEGQAHPTFAQAETFAEKVKIPFLLLFLSKPPSDELPLPDLRTIKGVKPSKPSPDFLQVITDVTLKQQWYREYQVANGHAKLDFVGNFSINGTRRVADAIRDKLTIDDDLRMECRNWEQFLTKLVRLAESLGIIVMRSSVVGNDNTRKLNVAEFRGFAISDDFAPVVFINSRDAKAAQIFTLAHELAHLWLGANGISNPDPRKQAEDFTDNVERFCNAVAAELLVPADEFQSLWESRREVFTNIRAITRHFKVSSIVAIIRARDLTRLTVSEAAKLINAEYERYRSMSKREEPKEGEGNFWKTFNARNGRLLVDSVTAAIRGNAVTYTDAASILSVKVATIEKYTAKTSKHQ